MEPVELLWKKYDHEIVTHKGYLDLVVKLNVFYYAVTGAILSFYFVHIEEEPLVKYSLILPFLMSIGLTVFFIRSAFASRHSQTEIRVLAEALKFKTFSVVAAVLENLLWTFSILMIVVALGLFVLFFIGPINALIFCLSDNSI